jgi:homogentisate 1,2-dioxygenase
MLETRAPQQVTAFAAQHPVRQRGYGGYGAKLAKHFDPTRRDR